MRLFAIGDLHLSGGDEKPMDVFGPQWDRHFFHISEAWRSLVREEDAVLIPGDISWAMRLEDAVPDLKAIGELPGIKILCKGNHDYWWNSITRVRSVLPDRMTALQHDAAELENCVICGTRGWITPTREAPLAPEDRKIYCREVQRLKLSLEAARALNAGKPLVVMTHFPPLTRDERENPFVSMLEACGAAAVVYGHLHGSGIQNGFTGVHHGIAYTLASCDSIGFTPVRII
ncbi:MAG: metallophosphoesterase [Clostridia bacterium]|nr:metallophosphoesterase [Clostridia bacterium]